MAQYYPFSGKTQIAAGSTTVLGIGPGESLPIRGRFDLGRG
jgi:peptidyl-tRNA hydrolase